MGIEVLKFKNHKSNTPNNMDLKERENIVFLDLEHYLGYLQASYI